VTPEKYRRREATAQAIVNTVLNHKSDGQAKDDRARAKALDAFMDCLAECADGGGT